MKIEDLKLDFNNDKSYRRRGHRGKSEILAKALGLSKGYDQVLDLTCGLALDAFFMAELGFKVEGFERSQEIYHILKSSLERARNEKPDDDLLKRIDFFHQDSIAYLQSSHLKSREKAKTVLYIDPMFPEKKKSALPRKEMVLFRQVVGADEDSGELLDAALQSGFSRIVVKRPLKAAPLKPGFIHQFIGQTVRYDLYSR